MSIAEVARRAGVSTATVSRVINKRHSVSPAIAQVVREAADALGYEPPPLDRRPGRRVPVHQKETSGNIAVVILDELYHHTPGVFAAHLSGIEREAAEHGWGVLVFQVASGSRLPSALSSKNVDGVILMGAEADPAVHRALERFTSIWLSSHHEQTGDSVLAGNHQIGRIAAEYLIKRGHRHLGFLSVMSSYPAYPARAEAFRFFAEAAGATVSAFMDEPESSETLRAQNLDHLQTRIAEQVNRLAASERRPTGLFVPNDMMTAMCYVALRSRGVVPGRDIDVVSCNNEISYLVGLDPRPATIDIGAEMIGRRSVEQLLRRIRHPAESRQVQIAVAPVLIEPPGETKG